VTAPGEREAGGGPVRYRVARFYITTPIYYVKRRAPCRACLRHGQRRTHWPRWHRLIGDDVLLPAPTEHGAKVAEAAAERGRRPR